ncbi:MAG: peptide chain release factor 1 [Anaerolineae bacterium]|nr:peptide chain release factor 1 [Anaerolineae bacterium]
MLEKLAQIEERYQELTRLMAEPEIAQDYQRVAELAKERSDLEDVVTVYREFKATSEELKETAELLEDDIGPELRELAEMEVADLEERKEQLRQRLRTLLIPKDPRDVKDVIVEIRAGAGGDEAALFAADLYRLYTRYAEQKGWRTEVLSSHPTGIGGFKEVVFDVKGRGAFSHFKYERGVHRVQRVPVTESSGRIHTSTATVAVLPEVSDVEVEIKPDDIEMEAYRSSGPGGQHMQKNATAIRMTHKPSGITVACESERSQTKNKRRALSILRSRLYEQKLQKQQKKRAKARRMQVGTGDRSEKIRTYNFPQNRITDHRIGLTIHRLSDVLDGDLDSFVEALRAEEQKEKLEALDEAV